MVQRALIVCRRTIIGVEEVALDRGIPGDGRDAPIVPLAENERRYIREVLERRSAGHRKRISRHELRRCRPVVAVRYFARSPFTRR